ncbi:hypothetical protein CASFOL_017475 [Castilleja foliolosa]|uniref:Uncharacterized protein n=1 Tax=Castilleja foliolosa TaxID=1961234 RepID=A0ABD3DB50_9LAMI
MGKHTNQLGGWFSSLPDREIEALHSDLLGKTLELQAWRVASAMMINSHHPNSWAALPSKLKLKNLFSHLVAVVANRHALQR